MWGDAEIEEIKITPMDGKIHLDAQKEVTEASTEQWKGGGDCGACRRQAYCGTPCRAKKVRLAQEIETERARMMQEMIMGMMQDAKGSSGDEDAEGAEE